MKSIHCLGMLATIALISTLGCGSRLAVEPGVIVKGKVLQDGQPVGLAGGEELPPGMEDMMGFEIQLVPQGGIETTETHLRGNYFGEYNASDGTIVFMGPGKGVPPGAYTLTVSSVDAMPDDYESDPFAAKFSAETSPFTVNVPDSGVGGEHDFGTIDLSQPPAAGS